jgi:hypothetical protein
MRKFATKAATVLALVGLAVVIWTTIVIPALIGWKMLLTAAGVL